MVPRRKNSIGSASHSSSTTTTTTTERTTITTRNRNNKASDKPKRPLSAYNFFFRMERQKLLDETEQYNRNLLTTSDPADRAGKHKPKLGFASLARYIAAKWKSIDDETMAFYQDLAEKEQRRYMKELVEWKIEQAHKLYDNNDDDFPCSPTISATSSNTNTAGRSSVAVESWSPASPPQLEKFSADELVAVAASAGQKQQQQQQHNHQQEQLQLARTTAETANIWNGHAQDNRHFMPSEHVVYDLTDPIAFMDSFRTSANLEYATAMGEERYSYSQAYKLQQQQQQQQREATAARYAQKPAVSARNAYNNPTLVAHERHHHHHHTASQGINTRWSQQHLEYEMEESIKALSKEMGGHHCSNGIGPPQSYPTQELEPVPLSFLTSAGSASDYAQYHHQQQQLHHAATVVAGARSFLVIQQTAVPTPSQMVARPPDHNPHHFALQGEQPDDGSICTITSHDSYNSNQNNEDEATRSMDSSSSSPYIQRLSLHLDQDEQEFLIARLSPGIPV